MSANLEASTQFQIGLDLKAKGQFDAALTTFRRAVIADPTFIGAHMEIGALCREKAKQDKMYLRYAFEAYHQAARLDMDNQTAHDAAILTGQQLGRLEELHEEYDRWSKQFPDHQLIQRCFKNIMAIEMAMIPQPVELASAKASGTIKKLTLFGSLAAVLMGLLLILVPPMVNKDGRFTKEQLRSFFRLGVTIGALGLGGVVAFTQIK